MGNREERVIQSESALTWIWFHCYKDYENQSGDHREITHGIRLKQHKAQKYKCTFKYIVYIHVISEKP